MPLPVIKNESPKHPFSSIKSVIGIAAGKGGVGKSSVTVNLALALKSKGFRVGIMDTDIYGPSIRRMLPEDQFPSQKGDIITPAICMGIKMLSMAYFRKENEATAVRAPIANGLITQFIKNVRWGELDYLLIDFPPGTGDIQLTLSQQANLTGALMVTTPQEVSVMDVRKAMHLFNQVKIPIIGVVENMSYYQCAHSSDPIYLFGQGGGRKLADETGVPFLGEIPLDPFLCQNCDNGYSLFDQDPEATKTITKAFLSLATTVDSHLNVLHKEGSNHLNSFEMKWKTMDSI